MRRAIILTMRRINVIGGSGSGKTTVGRALAARLLVPFIEIDQLHWDRYPRWTLPPLDEFRLRVDEATRGDRWVIDGSYGKVRDIVWSRADTVVWLDVSFALRLARVLSRTVRRSWTGEILWGIQKDSLRTTLLSRDSLLLFMIRTEAGRHRLYREWLARPENAHVELIRLRSQREIERWLSQVTPSGHR
jgi:adenylate kinase family enzyme